jgi:ribose-phosphate pyrophosphokinase
MCDTLEKLVSGFLTDMKRAIAEYLVRNEDFLLRLANNDHFIETLAANEKFVEKIAAKMRNDEIVVFSYRDVMEDVDGVRKLRYQDPIAKEIAEGLGMKLGNIHLDEFLDKTHLFTLKENVRRKDVYVIFNPDPAKDPDGEIFRFMMLTKTLARCHARNITAVVPDLTYSRQDQSYGKRQLVTAKFIAETLESASIDHMITIGLHSPQIEGFYKSIDHLKTRPVFAHFLKEVAGPEFADIVEYKADYSDDQVKFYRECVTLISPDAGGMRAVNELRRDMDEDRGIDVGFIQKERIGRNLVDARGKVVADVKGKIAVIYDDMLDSGGTLFKAAKALKEVGAKYVIACLDHALANSKPGEASFEEKLADSEIDELAVTNTCPQFYDRVMNDDRLKKKVTVLSIAPLLKEAIIRDQQGYTIRDMITHVGSDNLYRVLHRRTGK